MNAATSFAITLYFVPQAEARFRACPLNTNRKHGLTANGEPERQTDSQIEIEIEINTQRKPNTKRKD